MWWSRRLVLTGLAALAGCGFTPAYGPQGNASRLAGNVRVVTPDRRDGFLLRQRLEERLGRNDGGQFELTVSTTLNRQGLATSPDGTTNRFRLTGVGRYDLRDLDTGQSVLNGAVTNFTGYSATGSTVATLAAERDAVARLMVILADQVIDRLVLTADVLAQ